MSNTAIEIIELREELQRTRLLLQNCNGDIVRADRELASLREQLNSQKDRCIDLFQKVSEREEVIRELTDLLQRLIDGEKSFIKQYPRTSKNIESLLEKAKSLTTKDK